MEPKSQGFDIPEWWHLNGNKMEVAEKNEDSITIKSSSAELHITKRGIDSFNVRWKTNHLIECVEGNLIMTSKDVYIAFGLSDNQMLTYKYCDELDTKFLQRFGGTVGRRAHFLRYKNYLNIPCPGTSYDGDPNISIFISDEIKKEVEELLQKTGMLKTA